MEEVRRVWGNRPIRRNNDKHFYGTIWDFEMGRFREVFLGDNKVWCLERVKMVVSFIDPFNDDPDF